MGILISMEGPDGSGKTLQLNLLEEHLQNEGYKVLRTREPGGTPIGEAIREVILNPEFKNMDPVTEALLYAASRAQHVSEKLIPALTEEGLVVLLDRYLDSSLVYQGIGRGLGMDEVEKINAPAIRGLYPDVTFLVYIDYEEGLRRKNAQEGHDVDRLEQEQGDFHRKVNEGYLQLLEKYPDRVILIDGARSPLKIHEDIWEKCKEVLK